MTETIVPKKPKIRVKPNGSYVYVTEDYRAEHEWERCNPQHGSKVIDNSYGAVIVQKGEDGE